VNAAVVDRVSALGPRGRIRFRTAVVVRPECQHRGVGNVDRGLQQLTALWSHPDFRSRLNDGQERDREPLHDELRRAVLARDRFMCGGCYASPSPGVDGECLLQVDHLIPVAGGGSDESTNLRTLCARCNEEKSNRFTADVRAARPRLIVAYCLEDVEVDADEDDLPCNHRVFCAYCRTLRSVGSSHTRNFELSRYLTRESAFTDLYTHRLLSLGRSPQISLSLPPEAQDRWRVIFREVRQRRHSW
jgi:5-methylcytosine-specific restriction protein A